MVILRKLERKTPNFMEAYNKKNFQVRDVEYNSLIFPNRISLGNYK